MAMVAKDSTLKPAQNGSVRVEIFDQAYNLRGSDPEYILKLAEYVDAKMRAVSEQTHTVDTSRLAVLAALNIADEFHLLKRGYPLLLLFFFIGTAPAQDPTFHSQSNVVIVPTLVKDNRGKAFYGLA